MDMVDGNLHALNKYMDEQDKQEKAYEAMMDELTDSILERLDELREEHNQIVKKYDMEQSFIETIKDIL